MQPHVDHVGSVNDHGNSIPELTDFWYGIYRNSLQWDCGLVSRIGSQGSVTMTHGRPPHGMC